MEHNSTGPQVEEDAVTPHVDLCGDDLHVLDDDINDALDAIECGDAAGAQRVLEQATDLCRVVLARTIRDEALRLLDDGLPTRAAERLEAFARPKWRTRGDCVEAYDAAMAETRARAA